MSLHLTGTDAAHTVRTPTMQLMRNAVHVSLTLREIALAYGPPGTGKTFAAHTVADELIAELTGTGAPTRLVRVQVPKSRSPKTLCVEWLTAITGTTIRGTEYELKHELVDLLGDGATVSLIEEAQHLGSDGLEQVREIYDRVPGNVALIVVGSSTLDDVVRASPQLQSRVARPVRFDPIAVGDLGGVLAQYHPLFDGADPAVIARIDHAFAHRNFRRWARVLQAGLRQAPVLGHRGPIDNTMADLVLAELVARR